MRDYKSRLASSASRDLFSLHRLVYGRVLVLSLDPQPNRVFRWISGIHQEDTLLCSAKDIPYPDRVLLLHTHDTTAAGIPYLANSGTKALFARAIRANNDGFGVGPLRTEQRSESIDPIVDGVLVRSHHLTGHLFGTQPREPRHANDDNLRTGFPRVITKLVGCPRRLELVRVDIHAYSCCSLDLLTLPSYWQHTSPETRAFLSPGLIRVVEKRLAIVGNDVSTSTDEHQRVVRDGAGFGRDMSVEDSVVVPFFG